jgi:hypothetical protein
MSTLYCRSGDVLWRNAGNRVVLRRLDGDSLISLEGSGTLLWTLLATPISFDDLVAAMASHYAVDLDMVSDSVERVLADLEESGLVTSTEPPDARRSASMRTGTSLQTSVEEAAQ